MVDSVRARCNAQKKIIILGEIVPRSKSADFADEGKPNGREVTKIIVGQKEIRRPIGFEEGGVETSFGQLVFVGIDQVGVRILQQLFHRLEKGIGFQQVVMIEEGHPFTLSCFKSDIGREGDAAILFPATKALLWSRTVPLILPWSVWACPIAAAWRRLPANGPQGQPVCADMICAIGRNPRHGRRRVGKA